MSGKSKKAGNLVALGSAAVVAVYGAGFMRTASAAERFAAQSDERVLAPEDAAAVQSNPQLTVPVANGVHSSKSDPPSDLNTDAKTDAKVAPTPAAATAHEALPLSVVAAPSRAPANKADATRAQVASQSRKATVASPSAEVAALVVTPPEATAAAIVAAPVNAPANAPTAPVSASAPTQASTPVTAPVTAPATTQSTTVEPAPASVAAPKLKDGEYTGYGTSRHGDVEVYLETTDGKITYVKISQCLTQYSCSWIADLPKQVLTRQSANVDGVSGATQSANAFYYAVVQALAKAK